MKPRTILRNLRYVARGTYLAIQRGDLFPAVTRQVPTAAPGGTSETMLVSHFRETHRFVHSVHHLPMAGLTQELRVLHLSDAHVRGDTDWVRSLAETLEGMSADLVLLTGDMVTKHWEEAAVRRLLAALPEAPLGRFAVMGNWEHWAKAPPERWGALLAEHDVRLLLNEAVDLGPIGLAGTDDHLAGPVTPAQLASTLSALPSDKPAVVMSHSPAFFPELAHRADLVLSGHAHGGQILFPKLGAFMIPLGTGEYIAGWYQQDGAHLFVSRGIGWSLAPIRWRCPPEIAELVLTPI